MPFEIVKNDICNMQVDAIVNAANPRPVVGYGVDFGIHQRAGKQLLQARKKIGNIDFGDAAITPAYDLVARYVIHAVSPVWLDGQHNEPTLLEQCYEKSLSLALEHKCQSIAFPLLASGNNAFPKELALQIAISTFSKFLLNHEMQIYLVVFDRHAVMLSEKLFQSVKSFIDERYVEETYLAEYEISCPSAPLDEEIARAKALRRRGRRNEKELFETFCSAPVLAASLPRKLEDLMDELDESFSENLLRLIDQKGLKDPDVYRKANIDRKLFNKIKNNKSYKPSKNTCLAFALALELNLDETRDFIGKAGYALTHSSKFDIIIEYFINEKNYNILEINEVLFAFEQPLISA